MRALAPPLGVRLGPSCGLGAQRRTHLAQCIKHALRRERLPNAPLAPPARQRLRRRVVASSAPKGAPPDQIPQDAPLLPPVSTAHSSTAEAQSKADLYKASGVTLGLLVAAGAISHDWVGQHEALALSGVFVLGYAGIIFEEFFAFNKSGVALLTAVGMWSVRAAGAPSEAALNASLGECLADVSQIVFFLIGAMTVVETVDAHAGFKLVTDAIGTRDKKALLWLVGGLTFCMSAILDNLTSTIVMVSLLRKLVKDPEQRKTLGAVVVIAANAGGAWTPIGDVTTTMLWINGQISSLATMRDIFLPAAVSLIVPLALLSGDEALTGEQASTTRELLPLRAGAQRISLDDADDDGFSGTGMDDGLESDREAMAPRATLVFAAGVAALVFVPVFKTATGLPPYMGMLFGLGALWLLTDAIHYGEPDRAQLKVPEALSRIDTQGVLFFLGILLAISSLDSAGVLKQLASFLDAHIPSVELIAIAIGLVSAVIDNVPLVAATMGMYDLAEWPRDSTLWQLIAYCAGTGGSILVIGSAAGVAFMGMEKADFVWYLRRVSPVALAGYLAGVGTYIGMHALQAQPALAALSG